MNDIEKIDLYTRIKQEFPSPMDQNNLKEVFINFDEMLRLKKEVASLKQELEAADQELKEYYRIVNGMASAPRSKY